MPILKNDRYIGLTGVDIPLTKFQTIIDNLESFKNSYTFLVANNGHFVAHPASKFINRSILDFSPECAKEHQILERIRRGENFSFISKNFSFDKEAYVSFVPFQTGRTDTPWSIGIVVPMEEILKEANTPFYLSVSTGILGFFAIAFVIWIISSNITKPLKSTTELFKKLAGGQISDAKRLIVSTNDEIGDMTHSANTLLDGLHRTTAFAKKIGNGDLNADYQLLSSGDTLGKSLIEMRNQLKESRKAIQSQAELLTEKNKDLEKLNAAKDKFFSIIAHDLKNPFSVLLSVTESLSEAFGNLSDEDKNMSITRINKSVTLLYNLLENLLQWSMSQTGRLKFSPVKNNLYLLFLHNISLLKMNAEKRNISIVNNLKEDIPVFVDTDMINTVIRNLVSNAIKFNVDGGTIEINAKQKNNSIEIEISDTGIGLTDEDINKLFRIDVKNTSIGSGNKEKGTGIGLIICKEFVEKNNGKISVSSKKGEGSKFSFSVPIYKS
jgi:signal transduction histidine kinase